MITGEKSAIMEEELDIRSSIRGRSFQCTDARVYDENGVAS